MAKPGDPRQTPKPRRIKLTAKKETESCSPPFGCKYSNDEAHLVLVDCGTCRYSFAHTCPADELTCPNCGFHSDICDFPDTNSWQRGDREAYEKLNPKACLSCLVVVEGKVYDAEARKIGLEVPCMSHYPKFDHYCHKKANGCQLKEAK